MGDGAGLKLVEAVDAFFFQLAQDAVRFGDTVLRDGVGARLAVRYRIDAEFVRIARGSYVSNIAIAEIDSNAVGVVHSHHLTEAKARGEKTLQFLTNDLSR